jgi:diguanylate cyclase (GGDEF)-like protein
MTPLAGEPMRRSRVVKKFWADTVLNWKRFDDGRLWLGIYLVQAAVLIALAIGSTLLGAPQVSGAIVVVILPYIAVAMRFHRRNGRPHKWLPLDQVLAALCLVISPTSALGTFVCILVAAVTATLGLPVRRVQAFSALATAIVLVAAWVHHLSSVAAFALPMLASACALANLVSYLKNKRTASIARFEALLDGLHAYVYEVDLDTKKVVYTNRQTLELLGEVHVLDDLLTFVHPEDLGPINRANEKGLATMSASSFEVRIVVGDRTMHMEQRLTFARYRGHTRVRSVLFDISARKRAEVEMEHRAFHDSLTGLPNRLLFLDRLERAVVRGETANTKHAVLLLDLDNFKDVNDGMGHAVGDELLVEVGSRLNRCMRRTDTLARLGGDEFAVLLEDTDEETALQMGARLCKAVSVSYLHSEMTLFPRVSVGIASFPSNGSTSSELLRQADMAMYHAKRLRLGVIGFNEEMNSESAQKLAVLADFRSALSNNELEAFFQPVVNSESGKVTSCEALVRWNHPTQGLLSPAAFVPVVCAGGLSSELAQWMLREVIEQIDVWNKAGVAVPISVNMSAVDIADTALVDWLLGEIADRQIPARLLSIELTEAELLDQSLRTIETLKRLREAGIATAVDDFGTGYSSLIWLRDLPIGSLKIDRSFIDSMFTDERSETIVRSTIEMAKALHLKIIGEGVENIATASALRELGCDSLQGYLFSKPVTAALMKEILVNGVTAKDFVSST